LVEVRCYCNLGLLGHPLTGQYARAGYRQRAAEEPGMSDRPRRVVITGLGIIRPLGNDVPTVSARSWANCTS
jgi:hypothetical protein